MIKISVILRYTNLKRKSSVLIVRSLRFVVFFNYFYKEKIDMKRILLLPIFSLAMFIGLAAFAEENSSDVEVSVSKAEQISSEEENPLINAVRRGMLKG